MLHEFLTTHREAIIARARKRVTSRPWPPASPSELENGVPLFLTQLSDTLRTGAIATRVPSADIGDAGARHGGALMALGFSVSQVVHDYGDICQAVTEIALEEHAQVTTDEFHTLNRCLDDATARAVTEHARLTAEQRNEDERVRLGQVSHELRNLTHTALLAFQTLKHGQVAINGSTGMVLGRTLMAIRDTVDSTLCEVRLGAGLLLRERIQVSTFVNEIAVVANLHAEYRQVRLRIEHVDDRVMAHADAQVLTAAVMNLLNNAMKFTPVKGRVKLSAFERDGRLIIEVEDQCGGIPDAVGDPFAPFVDRRGPDRTGLGLGLSIARKAIRAHGGDIQIRNTPGHGCVFSIDIPTGAAA